MKLTHAVELALEHHTTVSWSRLDDRAIIATIENQGPAPAALEIAVDHDDRLDATLVYTGSKVRELEVRRTPSDVERLADGGFSR